MLGMTKNNRQLFLFINVLTNYRIVAFFTFSSLLVKLLNKMSPDYSANQTEPQGQPYYLPPEKPKVGNVIAKKTGRAVYLVLQLVIGIAMFGILLYLFVLPVNIVDGISMAPNFCNKDIYFTYKLESYFARNPYKRGDVIALKKDKNTNLIKRIVGMPGETIAIRQGKVYINGELFDEPYLQANVITGSGTFFGTSSGQDYKIPAGKYFALGDNRPYSLDSRDIGPVDPIENEINGKVVLVIWPPQRMRIFDPNAKFSANACD